MKELGLAGMLGALTSGLLVLGRRLGVGDDGSSNPVLAD
jgi:hypothetical protein